jgi:hypothetical protein
VGTAAEHRALDAASAERGLGFRVRAGDDLIPSGSPLPPGVRGSGAHAQPTCSPPPRFAKWEWHRIGCHGDWCLRAAHALVPRPRTRLASSTRHSGNLSATSRTTGRQSHRSRRSAPRTRRETRESGRSRAERAAKRAGGVVCRHRSPWLHRRAAATSGAAVRSTGATSRRPPRVDAVTTMSRAVAFRRRSRRGLTELAADERLAEARCARDDVSARTRSGR